jgi:hypothetical protein
MRPLYRRDLLYAHPVWAIRFERAKEYFIKAFKLKHYFAALQLPAGA